MNEDVLNMSVRESLKKVGIIHKREIDEAVRAAVDSGGLRGSETRPAKATLRGGGMAAVIEATQNRSWTQEEFLRAGYAVAWLRYRAEVDYAYDRIGRLIEDRRQGRQLLNRGPLEYEDVIAIAEYVKTLPSIDP